MQDRSGLELLLKNFQSGEIELSAAVDLLQGTAATSHAVVDTDRRKRCGYPEVVFAQGKTPEAMVEIFEKILGIGEEVLATRMIPESAAALLEKFPDATYNPRARTFRILRGERPKRVGKVAILSAGTSDFPVAEEARETADWAGAEVVFIEDVGVAGPHRLPAAKPQFVDADAIVVVAGMEGALPSVVGGHVDVPVIAVPTSVGYGASLGGMAALLGMLNSCASNVTVVNIDAGFKAGYVASLIAKNRHAKSNE